MRAKLPSKEGFVERDGVKIHYEVYGDGPETMVFLPPWSIVHSRVYKAQLPYFSERFRCITFDPRGNGKSDRPTEAAAYSLDNYIGDILAVMDATDAGKAILVGLSLGGMHACVLAAHHPERVKAAILAGTAATIGPGYPYLTPKHFTAKRERFEGWDKYNRDYWLAHYPDFAEHFVRNIFSEPHSTKQIEDGIEWASETTGPVLAKTVEARAIPPTFDVGEAMYRKIDCPVLMIHGDNDQIQPYARAQVGGRADGRRARHHSGRRAQSAGPLSGEVQRPDQRFPRSQARHSRAGKTAANGDAQSQEGALSLLAHRPRARAARHRHHARAAQAASRSAGRLAGAGPGDAPARGQRRAHPSAECAAGQRVAPHRAGVGRARSQRLPGHPPHGRGADRQLHDLPGCRRARAATTS